MNRKDRILQNDCCYEDPKTGKIVVSDLIEQMIRRCTFHNRYFITFTYPRTKDIAGRPLDPHMMTGHFICFLRKFAKLKNNHLLPIFATAPDDERFHIHAILLAEKAIDKKEWQTLASKSSKDTVDTEEVKRMFWRRWKKENPLTGHRPTDRADEADAEDEVKEILKEVVRRNRMMIGNAQRKFERSFEKYDETLEKEEWKIKIANHKNRNNPDYFENRKANVIGYIFSKHYQSTAYVFCPQSKCTKNKCNELNPFQNLTGKMEKTWIIKTLHGRTKE